MCTTSMLAVVSHVTTPHPQAHIDVTVSSSFPLQSGDGYMSLVPILFLVELCVQTFHGCISKGWIISPSGHTQYRNEKFPCGPKGIFPIDHNCKRDICSSR